MFSVRALPAAALLLFVTFAGCISGDDEGTPDVLPPADPLPPLRSITNITVENLLSFAESVVTPAQGVLDDLYEPTIEVSDTGAIYVAGHVIEAATTGTPAYYSTDDGKTWAPLPFLASLQAPPPAQGSQPPPGDEGFIVAGDDGRAWMADIYAAGFTVSGWCNDGAELCYDNRYAYDRVADATKPCLDPAADRPPVSLNDRPWAAYADGTLLLVNNPGGGPMQIGVMDVPPAAPVGLFDPVTGPTWNLCASPEGWIPGIPAMRKDGFFAVPQMAGAGNERRLTLTTGNKADIFEVKNQEIFKVTSGYGGTSNGGRTAFDADGTLYVGAYNNTRYDPDAGDKLKDVQGRFILATSADNATSFVNVTFETGSPVRSLYLDSNPYGPGALLSWSQLTEDQTGSDWYVAHVYTGPHGEPVLENVTRAVEDGPHSAAHVMGAGVGPDGRAYFVTFDGGTLTTYTGSTPISVWIQQTGPKLPVS